MAVVAYLLIAGAVAFIYFLIQDYNERKRVNAPGPAPLPLIGNTLEGSKNFHRILDWQYENTLKYGQTWTFTVLGQPRRIITANPLNVEHILKKNFENYQKGEPFTARVHDLLGDGIFNADGENWRVQRKTASNIFSVKNFRDNMCHVFVHHGKKVVSLLGNLKEKEAINMHDLFHRFTLDSIGDIAFGIEIGSIEDATVPFARAFDFAQFVVFQRFTSPFWRLNKYFSSDEAKFRASNKVLSESCYKAIRERREAQKRADNKEETDLLGLFMSKKDENGNEYSDDYLRDLMMNFVIAGRDTTANGLSWAFYMISQHPKVEEKLRKEILEYFGDDEPSYEVKNMPYATAFVSEVLRLYPSVPKDPKCVVKDDVLPDGTKVHAGDFVVYVPYTMGRLEALWGKDALEFKPERWLEEDEKTLLTQPSPYKYPVFQAGPRTCLGQDMAYLEMKVMISMILQKYSPKLVPGQDIRYQNNITLPMVDCKMMMYFEKVK